MSIKDFVLIAVKNISHCTTAGQQTREDCAFKYESMRIEWIKYFEKENRRDLKIVKDFFYNFHNNHQQLRFIVAKIFDGTTHVLVNDDE